MHETDPMQLHRLESESYAENLGQLPNADDNVPRPRRALLPRTCNVAHCMSHINFDLALASKKL
jgi:hypothetical protein